ARDVVALEDVVERHDLLLEGADDARMADDHADERGDVEAEPARVEDRAVAGDDAGRLELLDALEHGGRGEIDGLAEPGERGPAVLLQEPEDLPVGLVQLHALVVA